MSQNKITFALFYNKRSLKIKMKIPQASIMLNKQE